MKPSNLEPGDGVRFTDSRGSAVLTFERRGAAVCWFRDANGLPCSAPDAFVARNAQHVQESRPRG